MVATNRIFYAQNIAELLIELEDLIKSLSAFRTQEDLRTFINYLISKVLFKSGEVNVVYRTNTSFDSIMSQLVWRMIEEDAHRYLPNLVLEKIYVPDLSALRSGENLWVATKGDLFLLLR